MSTKDPNYHDQQNISNVQKMREVLDTLPPFCKQFFRGISEYTSARTRLAYAYDIRVFFEYLHDNNSYCKRMEIRQFPLTILEQLTREDIEEYIEYLSYYEKDGKVYVAMSDKLLFESGSARVDKRGKEALAKLAEVLNKQSDIDVYIEGHTDSKPINTAQFKDNWDLSVIRATSVVRILTKDYGVNPLQIQPSGRGEYMPVADNESAEGRSKNRRTEIIMAPKLDKLYQMLQ